MFIYLGSNQDDYQNIKLCIITMCNMLVLCLLGEKDWPVHWFWKMCVQLCNYGCGNCVGVCRFLRLVAGGDLSGYASPSPMLVALQHVWVPSLPSSLFWCFFISLLKLNLSTNLCCVQLMFLCFACIVVIGFNTGFCFGFLTFGSRKQRLEVCVDARVICPYPLTGGTSQKITYPSPT